MIVITNITICFTTIIITVMFTIVSTSVIRGEAPRAHPPEAPRRAGRLPGGGERVI